MTSLPGAKSFSQVLNRLRYIQKHFQTKILTEIEMDGERYPIHHIIMGKGNAKRALITATIHGDEPAGVETALRFIEDGHFESFIKEWEIHVIPCANPTGYILGTRETHQQIDLNRQFKKKSTAQEVAVLMQLLETPYDLDLEIHEDVDSPGYYLFQKESKLPVSNLGRKILDAVSPLMPLNMAEEIEELPAEGGLIARLSDPDEMDWWPMALYAHHRGCSACFTLETSTNYSIEKRAEAHLMALRTAFEEFPGER